MTYRDKSTNRVVELKPSTTDFLIVQKSEGEAVHHVLDQKVFSVTRSTNADRVLILRSRNEQESAVEINREVEKLRQDPALEAVVPALIDGAGQTRFAIPGRVSVKMKGTPARRRQLIEQAGGSIQREFRASGLLEVRVPADTAVDVFIERLNALKEVVFAEPSYYGVDDQEVQIRISVGAGANEGEAVAPIPWNLSIIEAPGAWTNTTGEASVVVAIIDGVPDVRHEALAGKLLGEVDDSLYFTSDRSLSSHATNIAGVIAGHSSRVSGVAPDVRILPLVVNLNSQIYAERAEALATAAEIARDRRWNGHPFSRMVLSCSWRTQGDVAVIRNALQDLVQAGVVPVFSAGNDDSSDPHFPSDYGSTPGALGNALVSVAATDREDRKAGYSNYSAAVTLSAPGGDGLPLDTRDILCPDQAGAYEWAAGTSIAAPHVAAVVALMLSVNPNLDAPTIKRLLRESADDISGTNAPYANALGAGRVNARLAVEAAAAAAGSARPEPSEPDVTAPESPDTSAPVPDTGSAGAGPSFHVESVIVTSAANRIRERLARSGAEITALTGWSLTHATISDGTVEVTLEFP
jgi:subtilisin family serine protease